MSSRCPNCGGLATTAGFQHAPNCPHNPWRPQPDVWDRIEECMKAEIMSGVPTSCLERIAVALERIAAKMESEEAPDAG